jgi:hypothetical protein
MAIILYVRVKSDLEFNELERRVNERKPRFKEVPGFVQKFYGLDESTGDVCSIYFFEDKKSARCLSRFRAGKNNSYCI